MEVAAASLLVHKICEASLSASFRRHQCAVLQLRCLQVEGYLLPLVSCPNASARLALEELVRVLQRALWIVSEADETSWLHLALARHFGEEEFASVVQDLEACVELLVDRFSSELVKRKAEEGSACAQLWLREAAERDKHELVERLLADGGSLYDTVADFLLPRLGQTLVEEEASFLEIRSSELRDRKFIDKGASGKVFSASWLGQKVAVKCFTRDDRTYETEKQAMAKLVSPHPNVVQMLGCSRDTEGMMIVMELMKMNLRKYIDKWQTPLPLVLAVDIMLQIARGTRYLHGKNVVHRDLKPQNVLVDFKELDGAVKIKLTDFGIAKTDFETLVPEGLTNRRGTVRYMAPEMMANSSYSRKVEVWSFGMTCSEILTRQVPFGLEVVGGMEKLRELIQEGKRPPLPADIPEELIALIHDCWSGEPHLRPDFEAIEQRLAMLKKQLLTPLPACSVISTSNNSSSSSSSSSQATSTNSSLPSLDNLRFRGDFNVRGKITVQFTLANGAQLAICRWTRTSRRGAIEQMEPVIVTDQTSLKALTRHLTARDYDKKLELDCLPLGSGFKPGRSIKRQVNNGEYIKCGPRLMEKIERYFSNGQAQYLVQHPHQKWWESNGKLLINVRDFYLFWGHGNARNLRFEFAHAGREEESPLELCEDAEGQFLCTLRGVDGSRNKIKFLDQDKRDEAVLSMKYFWDRRGQNGSNRSREGDG